MKIFTPTVTYRLPQNVVHTGPHFTTFVLAKAWVEQRLSPDQNVCVHSWWIDEEEVHESLP